MIAETITIRRDVPIRNYAIMPTNAAGGPCDELGEPCFLGLIKNPVFGTVSLKHRPIQGARLFTTVGDAVTWISTQPGIASPDAEGLSDSWAIVGIPDRVAREIEAAAQHDWNHRDCHAENGRAA